MRQLTPSGMVAIMVKVPVVEAKTSITEPLAPMPMETGISLKLWRNSSRISLVGPQGTGDWAKAGADKPTNIAKAAAIAAIRM